MDIENFEFNLQMFADGAAAPGASVAGAGDGGTSEVSATGDTAVTRSKRKAKTDPYAHVVFGKQKGDPETAETEKANAEDKAEGKNVQRNGDIPPPSSTAPLSQDMRGDTEGEDGTDSDNKPKTYTEEEFNEAVDKEMKRRYKTNNKKMAPILRYVSEALGVELGDIDAMSEAADTARKQRYKEEAGRTGNDAEALEKNADNAYEVYNYREEMRAEKERKEADVFNSRMAEQEREVKGVYADFDFKTEIQNPVFRTLLKSGCSMRNAYECAHHTELVERARSQAVNETKEAITASVAAGAQRPTEGGATNPSAQFITDPKLMTKEQRVELKRRVRSGEKIAW